MKYDDASIEKMLTDIGRQTLPPRVGLINALRASKQSSLVRSPLSTISIFMNTATKVGVLLAAVLVVGGGIYTLSGSSAPEMAQGTGIEVQAMAANETQPTGLVAATASVEDLAAALDAELASQSSAVQALDTSVQLTVSDVNSITNTTTLYDETSI